MRRTTAATVPTSFAANRIRIRPAIVAVIASVAFAATAGGSACTAAPPPPSEAATANPIPSPSSAGVVTPAAETPETAAVRRAVERFVVALKTDDSVAMWEMLTADGQDQWLTMAVYRTAQQPTAHPRLHALLAEHQVYLPDSALTPDPDLSAIQRAVTAPTVPLGRRCALFAAINREFGERARPISRHEIASIEITGDTALVQVKTWIDGAEWMHSLVMVTTANGWRIAQWSADRDTRYTTTPLPLR